MNTLTISFHMCTILVLPQKYDSNAIMVINKSKQQIGHIKGTEAAPTSMSWDSLNAVLKPKGECLVATGTILDAGNGYEQSVQVEFKKIVIDPNAEVAAAAGI